MFNHTHEYLMADPARLAEVINTAFSLAQESNLSSGSNPSEDADSSQESNVTAESNGSVESNSSQESKQSQVDKDGEKRPIRADWIDMDATAHMTEVIHKIMPARFPFYTMVVVERDPAWKPIVKMDEELGHELRYLLLFFVTEDDQLLYAVNFGIFHATAVTGLAAWELARSTEDACDALCRVLFMKEPVLPILQRAQLEWLTLNMGIGTFSGSRSMSDHTQFPEDEKPIRANVAEIREMAENPVIKGLLDAYDADCGSSALR